MHKLLLYLFKYFGYYQANLLLSYRSLPRTIWLQEGWFSNSL